MDRPLAKCFEDERLRRLITDLQDLELLRQVALQLLELKIGQEQEFSALMVHWNGVTAQQVQALLQRPALPPPDPFDGAG